MLIQCKKGEEGGQKVLRQKTPSDMFDSPTHTKSDALDNLFSIVKKKKALNLVLQTEFQNTLNYSDFIVHGSRVV